MIGLHDPESGCERRLPRLVASQKLAQQTRGLLRRVCLGSEIQAGTAITAASHGNRKTEVVKNGALKSPNRRRIAG
jgi:hypothetical protein